MALQGDVDPTFTVTDFTLDGVALTIHSTDTDIPIKPLDQIQENERGQRRWYQRQPLASHASNYWREQIADELVHKFLFMDKGSKSGPNP
jgi:hypothetical protein